MTSWLIFSIVAPFMWALSNVLDGAIRRHFLKNDWSLSFFGALARLPLVLVLFWLGGFHFPDFQTTLLMFLVGFLWTLPFWLYFKSIHLEEPSRIALLSQLLPVFTVLNAFWLIGERLTVFQGVAFVLLLAAGILATLQKASGRWKLSSALFFMIIATFLWSFADVVFKKLEPSFNNFYSAFGVYALGSFCFGFLLLFSPSRLAIIKSFHGLSKKAWIMLIATQISGIVGSTAFAYALTLGKATLTNVLVGMQPLFAFGYSFILSTFIPEVNKEELKNSLWVLKLFSFILLVAGLWLLQA